MEAKLQLRKDVERSLVDSKEYRRIIGCLRYLKRIRPDISYAVGIVSQYMEQPTTLHQQVVKHILRYVKVYGIYCSVVSRTLVEKLVKRGARMRAESGNPLCRHQVCNSINEESGVSWTQQTHRHFVPLHL
ncbi:uncharacterized mitochondrial protein AtMg00810-like [Impatiens glandulifera]|uniref:uncharacterized mitochondrial protein AtMg00810-like n=1 Tax=Impatiens glandulifera TaxID=253017 RepID=UPI001FB0FD14|nr:uncharacterized mitochondrial protein AtMg00810-like [Impatiens glandulifera]